MKYILFLAFLFPLFLSAQDSCKLKKETDPFTHQTKISTGFVPFIADGVQLSISIDASSTDIDFFLWIRNDSKCFDDQSTIQINYEGDRLKSNFKNTGSMNCEGTFHFTFRNTQGTPSNLQRLATKNIKSIHLVGANKTIVDITFNEEQRLQFRRMTSCILRDAKSLLSK